MGDEEIGTGWVDDERDGEHERRSEGTMQRILEGHWDHVDEMQNFP
jgi:hypothetical protein